MTHVVVVDDRDNQISIIGKDQAHRGRGILHRAVSVILYRIRDSAAEILLQKRSAGKKLWPGFWSNTVCTHPGPGEDNLICAARRLREELGLDILSDNLRFLFKFLYQAAYTANLAEHELDSVYVGEFDGNFNINPDEVKDIKWVKLEEIKKDGREHPEKYTPWFNLMLKRKELFSQLTINY